MYDTVISTFLIGFTETLVVLITSMLITGRKDLLNIRNRMNILNLLIVTFVLTIIITLTRSLLGQTAIIIFLVAYIVTCIFVFKTHWIEAAAGVLIAAISLAAFEYISILLGSRIIGVTPDSNNLVGELRIFTVVVTRILQIILVIILYRFPILVVNFGTIKGFTKRTLRKLTVIYIYEAICIILFIKIGWSQFNYNSLSISDTTINIIVMCSFIVLNIIVVTKLMRNAMLEKKNNTITLLWFKHLLKQYRYDIAKIDVMVDDALNKEMEGGEYDER